MKKIYAFSFLFLALFLGAQFTHGQSLKIGISGELGLPMGDWSEGMSAAYGVNLDAKVNPSDRIGIGLKIGYLSVAPETSIDGYSYSIIPVNVSGEYFFATDVVKPYAGLAAGIYNHSVKFDFLGSSFSASESYFGVAPKAGVLVGLGETFNIHGYTQYNIMFVGDNGAGSSTAGMLGFNIGIMYGFGL